MNLIGLTKQQAEQALNGMGITQVEYINNFKNPMPNSTLLVTAYNIIEKTAQITLGSFKLDL